MKNLLPILALLLLVGCTSELDRCIEANFDEMPYIGFEEGKGFNWDKEQAMRKEYATKLCNKQGIY